MNNFKSDIVCYLIFLLFIYWFKLLPFEAVTVMTLSGVYFYRKYGLPVLIVYCCTFDMFYIIIRELLTVGFTGDIIHVFVLGSVGCIMLFFVSGVMEIVIKDKIV
ncbi:hypothetical protein [Methanococcus sp. CF]